MPAGDTSLGPSNLPIATMVGRGSTPSSGWSSQAGGAYYTKAITVAGALVGDVVLAVVGAAVMSGVAPTTRRVVLGYVSAPDTVTLYYTEENFTAVGAVTNAGVAPGAAISYMVLRP